MSKIILLSLTVTFFAGCSLSPDYKRPNVSTPTSWSETSQTSENIQVTQEWWKNFNSEPLNNYMQQALINNTDITAGLQTISQSRASLKISDANMLPSINASGSVGRSQNNPATGKTTYSSSISTGLNASYELDLFGANRANVEATQANLMSSIYSQDALSLVVMGDVAEAYFSLLNLRERLQIADSNLGNAKEILRIVQVRVDEGASSNLELAQQRTSVASSEASRASIVEQISNAENALAVLLGEAPQNIEISGVGLRDLTIPNIATGQPSELLERRPDLRAAEANLIAAGADIGAARAAFYPSISLGLGSSISLAGFGDPTSTALSIVSSLSAPIFQGGRLEGGVEKATARQLQLMENYRGAVLNAFQDVEDALAAVKSAQSREVSLQIAMEESQKAYNLSKERYDAGAIDFQTLLDTQNIQRSAEDNYAQAKLARLSAAISLFKALGGGWKDS